MMGAIDFNKLIRDIITAAREEAATNLSKVRTADDDNKLNITLKLEVTISENSTRLYQASQKSSKRLVMLTIDDHK